MNIRLIFSGMFAGMVAATNFPATALGAAEVASPAPATPLTQKLKSASVSPAVREIVQMSDAGMDASVIQAFVENSTTAVNPKAGDILYLHEHGISGTIITAMIQRSARLREQSSYQEAIAAPPAPAPASARPAVAPAQTTAPTYAAPAPGPTYVYPAAPTYVYSYPDVTYIPYRSYNYFSPSYSGYSRPYIGFNYSFGLGGYSHYSYGYGGYGGYGGRGFCR